MTVSVVEFRRLRIAVISRVFSKTGGGAESYSVALVQQLASRHDIHVFAQESSQPVPSVTYHRIFRLSRRPRWINQLLFAISTWIETRKGFDVVHSHENTWHGQVQTIHVRPLRYNLFHALNGLPLSLRWLKVALSPRLATYLFLEGARFKGSKARKVVVTSDNLLQECQQSFPGSRADISIITPGTISPIALPTRQEARIRLGVPSAGRYVLFVANDYARKGLDTLLQALVQLPSDVSLLVVGRPGAAPKYGQLAERLNLTERIHFLGSLDGMSDAYRAADCLAHPTLEDTFAMVVLEAMAHGLPVVVSGDEYCGISRQLTHGTHALLLTEPKNSHALAELVLTILTLRDLAQKLRANGLKLALAHSWEEAALKYESLYFQVA